MADVKKVLVVDDHFEMLEFLQSMLELSEYDYEVLAVPSAEEGMLELGRTAFDILITDVRLPGMSGFDFVRRARKRSRNVDLPVIMITAYASEQGRQEARELGVYRYFTKPFEDTDEVITAVNEILYGKPPATEAVTTSDTGSHIDIILPSSVNKRLQTLTTDTGAALVLLAIKTGQMLIETGAVRDVDTKQLASVISSNLINSKQLTQQLGGDAVTTIQYHAGEHLEMYTANIGSDYFMSIVFDVQVRRGRFGTMWVFTQRAIKDLLPMLPALPAAVEVKETKTVVEKTAVSPKKKRAAPPKPIKPAKPVKRDKPKKSKRRRGYTVHPDSASAGNIERAAKPRAKAKTAVSKDDRPTFTPPPPPDFSFGGNDSGSDDAIGLGVDDLRSLLGSAPAKTAATDSVIESDSELVPMDADALKNLLRGAGTAVSANASKKSKKNAIPAAADLAHLLELDDVPDDDAIDFGNVSAIVDEPARKQKRAMSFEEARRVGLIGGAALPVAEPAPVTNAGRLDDMLKNLENPIDLDAFWDTAISSTVKTETTGMSLEEARRQGFLSGAMDK